MSNRPIVLTKHASERALKYDLDSQTLKRIIYEGQKTREGKTKTRYSLTTKYGILVAICSESTEQIVIITLTKGK